MAVPVVTVQSASTQDSDPSNAPYRISKISGADDVDIRYRVTGVGTTLRYFQSYQGGSVRTARTKVMDSIGIVCGLGVRCATAAYQSGRRHPRSLARSLATPYDFGGNVNMFWSLAAMVADGSYTVGLEALNDDGWST